MGVLGEPNTNRKYKVDGDVANFRATYAADGKAASHVLSLTCYATDATADEEMWVLLGPKETAPLMLTTTVAPAAAPAAASASSRARGKQRKAPAATPMTAVAHGVDDAAIAAMSPAEAQALIMRLNARMGGNSSAADAALP